MLYYNRMSYLRTQFFIGDMFLCRFETVAEIISIIKQHSFNSKTLESVASLDNNVVIVGVIGRWVEVEESVGEINVSGKNTVKNNVKKTFKRILQFIFTTIVL